LRIAIYLGILVLGALCFSQAIAMMDLAPMPGDLKFDAGEWHVRVPVLYSLGVTAGLGLLIGFLKK
jgi:hypothetical protein